MDLNRIYLKLMRCKLLESYIWLGWRRESRKSAAEDRVPLAGRSGSWGWRPPALRCGVGGLAMGRRVASVSHFHFLMSLGNAGWRDSMEQEVLGVRLLAGWWWLKEAQGMPDMGKKRETLANTVYPVAHLQRWWFSFLPSSFPPSLLSFLSFFFFSLQKGFI